MRRASAILLTAALAACAGDSGPVNPDDSARLGALSHYNEPVQVTMPGEATVGVPFLVQATTFGGGCERAGETRAATAGLTATVTVFDEQGRGTRMECTADVLHFFAHETTITFAEAGPATVEVRGRREPGGEPFTVVRQVLVRAP